MLLAEIHGKRLDAARDAEDYLTSAVFGHLRYVPPAYFWGELFAAVKSLPDKNGNETTLQAAIGADAFTFTELTLHFWKNHPTLGEPDLILVFEGGSQPPLVVLIEVKLWAEKSGFGEYDQLARYLRILDDLGKVGVHVPSAANRFLIYLTPRESSAEVKESLAESTHPDLDRSRLFRLQWQDVLLAAKRSVRFTPEPTKTILTDVAAFLGRLGLEYFDGFKRVAGLPMLRVGDGAIFRGSLMARLASLEPIITRRASWAT